MTFFASWSTTPPADPLPTDGPADPIPGDPGYEYPRCAACHNAIDVPSSIYNCFCIGCANALHFGLPNRFMAEALRRQKAGACVNCNGNHITYNCPEVRGLLFR